MSALLRYRTPLALLLLVTAAVAGLLAARATARAGVREITIVARDMAFYTPGSDPNPAIPVRPGERVRIVLRNETPGMVHDLTIDGLDLSTTLLQAGETGIIEFTAPASPGRYEYYCRPHPVLMRGALEVR
jgi:plastocyanin